jgi:hypothetical protein
MPIPVLRALTGNNIVTWASHPCFLRNPTKALPFSRQPFEKRWIESFGFEMSYVAIVDRLTDRAPCMGETPMSRERFLPAPFQGGRGVRSYTSILGFSMHFFVASCLRV